MFAAGGSKIEISLVSGKYALGPAILDFKPGVILFDFRVSAVPLLDQFLLGPRQLLNRAPWEFRTGPVWSNSEQSGLWTKDGKGF